MNSLPPPLAARVERVRETVGVVNSAITEAQRNNQFPELSLLRSLNGTHSMVNRIRAAECEPVRADQFLELDQLERQIHQAAQRLRDCFDSVEGRQALVYCSRIELHKSVSGKLNHPRGGLSFPADSDHDELKALTAQGPWAVPAVNATWKAWAQATSAGVKRRTAISAARRAGLATARDYWNYYAMPVASTAASRRTEEEFDRQVRAVIFYYLDRWAAPIAEQGSEHRVLLVVPELLSDEPYAASPQLARTSGRELLVVPAACLSAWEHGGGLTPAVLNQTAEVYDAVLRLVVGGLNLSDAYQAALDIYSVSSGPAR